MQKKLCFGKIQSTKNTKNKNKNTNTNRMRTTQYECN